MTDSDFINKVNEKLKEQKEFTKTRKYQQLIVDRKTALEKAKLRKEKLKLEIEERRCSFWKNTIIKHVQKRTDECLRTGKNCGDFSLSVYDDSEHVKTYLYNPDRIREQKERTKLFNSIPNCREYIERLGMEVTYSSGPPCEYGDEPCSRGSYVIYKSA